MKWAAIGEGQGSSGSCCPAGVACENGIQEADAHRSGGTFGTRLQAVDTKAGFASPFESCVQKQQRMIGHSGGPPDGYTFSQFGCIHWYSSFCVKPPILFADINRPGAMTVAWRMLCQIAEVTST